ncbi:hypothetical protein NLS1_26360 [Nocardioides sp. LS1]|nr:hypothetical protein NLS1_26360 [Nocardioides sp. LS1]
MRGIPSIAGIRWQACAVSGHNGEFCHHAWGKAVSSRRRSANPVVEHRRRTMVFNALIALMAVITAYLVFRALTM